MESSKVSSRIPRILDHPLTLLKGPDAAECIQRYNKLAEKIAEFRLEDAIIAPPIINVSRYLATEKSET